MRGVYHRAGPPGPASGRPDGKLRPDPVAYCALRHVRFRVKRRVAILLCRYFAMPNATNAECDS